MSPEDDWDRNRCSHGVLGKEDCPFFDDDRGMGMSAFDSPEEEMEILRGLQESQEREIEEAEVNKVLGWNMRHETKEKWKMMIETKQAGACECGADRRMTGTSLDGHEALEMSPYSMSHEMKEIFMLSNKAIDLMTDLFTGLNDENKETMRKMISKGSGPVDTDGESFMAVYGKVKALLVHIRRETSGGRLVQTFDIWKEGFEDEDGKEQAELLAKGVPGSDFHDAVKFWYESTINAEHIYGPLSVKGTGKSAKMWLWGCRLYDNEQDARKRFG